MATDLNSNILECIDAGLDSLGGAGKKTVYWYLQKCKVKIESIPERPSSLIEVLKTLFGQGAGILERTITRELKQRFNVTLGDDLTEVLSIVKQGRSIG